MTSVRRLLCAACLALSAPSDAYAQTPTPEPPASPQPAQIDRNGLMILIRSSLLALDQANKTGNYTVLRDLGAPGFAAANNPAHLGDIFANLRRDKVDLSGVLVLDPQLTVMPELTPNGMLHFAGFFPSAPSQINFEFLFAPVEGRWRIFGVSTSVGSSAPVAPAPSPTATPTPTHMPTPGPTAEPHKKKEGEKKPKSE